MNSTSCRKYWEFPGLDLVDFLLKDHGEEERARETEGTMRWVKWRWSCDKRQKRERERKRERENIERERTNNIVKAERTKEQTHVAHSVSRIARGRLAKQYTAAKHAALEGDAEAVREREKERKAEIKRERESASFVRDSKRGRVQRRNVRLTTQWKQQLHDRWSREHPNEQRNADDRFLGFLSLHNLVSLSRGLSFALGRE